MELPNEWLATAGMRGYVPTQPSYRAVAHENASLSTIVLPVTSIWLQARASIVPDFSKDRMIRLLEGIRLGHGLPPIEVETEAMGRFSHRLYNGRHRFAASLALGFTHIPAVTVVDLLR